MPIRDKDISDLKKYAYALLKDRQDISPDDIVQDSILKILESGVEMDLSSLKAAVKDLSFRNKLIDNRGISNSKTFSEKETTKFCKGCEQDLPMAMFSISTNHKKNITSLSHLCHKCEAKRMKRRMNEDPELRKRYNKRMNDYYHRKKLMKEIESKQYLKKAHSILEWQRRA